MDKLPDQLKGDNWALYVLSRSNDPSVMVPNTRKLVSNLIISSKLLNDQTYDNLIAECLRDANEAWTKYTSNLDEKGEEIIGWAVAVQDCEKIIDKVGVLIYNEDWAIMKSDSFVIPGGKK